MSATSASVRHAALLHLLAFILGAQLLFVIEATVGIRLPPLLVVSLLLVAWPSVATFVLRRRFPPPDVSREVVLWSLAGLAAWLAWASSYYLIGALVSEPRVLSEVLEARVPLVPAFSLLYICVHPLSLLPYVALQKTRELRRYFFGNLAVILISALFWLLFPVASRRPVIAPDAPDFGSWLLGTIYGNDPAVNCLPSTHCAVAVYAGIALWRVDRSLGLWALLTASAIGASTLFTKQHYVVDVLAGYALGGVAALVLWKWPSTKVARE